MKLTDVCDAQEALNDPEYRLYECFLPNIYAGINE